MTERARVVDRGNHVRRRARVIAALAALAIVGPAWGTGVAGADAPVGAITEPLGLAPAVPAGATPTAAPLPASITASVVLRPADPAGLQAYATAASTPGSPQYRHFLTPAEVQHRFGPSSSTTVELRGWLSSEGLDVRPTEGDGAVVPVTGTPMQLGEAFGTALRSYRMASGRTAYANDSAPRVPAGLAPDVQEVVGLDSFALPTNDDAGADTPTATAPQPAPHVSTAGPQPCAAASAASAAFSFVGPGGAPSHSVTADRIAPTYDLPPLYAQGDFGQGTTVAVMMVGADYENSDISYFDQCYGIDTAVHRVAVDGGAGVPPGGGGAAEVTMDIEAVAVFAPQAKILVYEAPTSTAGLLDDYAAMAQDDQAQVGTVSAGVCEPLNNSTLGENTVFEEMAAQGQTMFASSGDQGSEACLQDGAFLSNAATAGLFVNDPASQPFVVGVGGVYLPDLSDPSTATVWNDGPYSTFEGDYVGSGGYSSAIASDQFDVGYGSGWAMSPWQVGTGDTGNNPNDPNNPANYGSGCGPSGVAACRAVPDVTGDADQANNLLYYCGACGPPYPLPAYPGWWGGIGTSIASPEWAAVAGLINADVPGDRSGFLAPALYQIEADDPSAFVDVTTGNNDYLTQPNRYGVGNDICSYNGSPDDQPCYEATPGYDVASGLGLPAAAVLAADVRALAQSHGASFHGSMGGTALSQPIVGMAATSTGGGYWEVAADGGIFSFGDAAFHGSMGGIGLHRPIVGMASTANGKGYWEVAADGGIFSFGDAGFYGSMGGKPLDQPIVSMAATPDGKGYWEVAADGGIFSFGDAGFYGSMGGTVLNKPIVGMDAAPDGQGYWLVASDGGIFAFGDAAFYGSMGASPLNKPVVGMASTHSGSGYWEVAADGGIFSFP